MLKDYGLSLWGFNGTLGWSIWVCYRHQDSGFMSGLGFRVSHLCGIQGLAIRL